MTQRRLCEVKNVLIDISLKLVNEPPYRIPRFRFAIDELRCPNRNHCDESKPCEGFTPENRQRIAEIDDELFRIGFVKESER